jgi:hypothetical protein
MLFYSCRRELEWHGLSVGHLLGRYFMRLRTALLAFALTVGFAAAAVVVLSPASVSAGPKNPDCNGC